MRFITVFLVFAGLLAATSATAQTNEFIYDVPYSDDFFAPYTVDFHSGARGISGPYDLDADGQMEVLATDYSGGGRVYVIENVGESTWEVVWEMPWKDSTATSGNARYAVGTDLDGDGMGEIVVVGGAGHSATNPNIDALPFGLHFWEAQGDNDYGDLPTSTYTFPDDTPDRLIPEQMAVGDMDGDGVQELLMPNNGGSGGNDYDAWWVLSVSGDIGSGFEFFVEEARISSRGSQAFDPVNRGGGSAYAIHPADLNGDGQMDLSLHSWNNYNFTNGTVAGPDTYVFPDSSATNVFVQAASSDHVSLFGGVVVDMDGDGNDEVYYPRFQTGDVTVINYNEGDDPLQITVDNIGLDVIPDLTGLGIAATDFDGDGFLELVGSGSSYFGDARTDGEMPVFIRISEYRGGDVMDPASYTVPEDVMIGEPFDLEGFDIVTTDSAGVITTTYETASGGPIFTAKIAALGDVDGDGGEEVAASFQGVPDTYDVIDEFYDPDSLVGGFDTPDGGDSPAPIGPGESYSFSFDAEPGSFFNFFTMFVESNDLFYAAADTGIALWDSEGNMRSGDITNEIWLWDAGTELNEEPFVGPNQAPRQVNPGDGEPDTLGVVTLCCDHDPWDYPATEEVLSVDLAADEATGVFTVTITNVSTAAAGGKTAAVVPLSPGVYLIHDPGTSFEEGEEAPEGLEQIAEDANNVPALEALQRTFGFFRTLVETVPNPVRAFVRIFSWDGVSVRAETDRIVVPSDYKLSANYPNPFNPTTSFDFTLPIEKQISVKIYDVNGRLVRTLINDELRSAGTHTVSWDGRDAVGQPVASGNYIYTLEYGNFRQTRSMVLLK